MDTRGVQVDALHPTGTVAVSLEEGQPAYHIVPRQAYDFIVLSKVEDATRHTEIALLYHGSLAIRHDHSRHTLQGLCEQFDVPRCIDINLRAPWWHRETVLNALNGAYCVKLNDEELMELISPDAILEGDLQNAAERFHEHYDLQVLIVTRGARGALMITPDGVLAGAPVAVETVMDTVGAGDAFSAVVLLGLLRGWAWTDILDRALAFAARICTVRGATIKEKGVYAAFLDTWVGDSGG